MRRPHYLLMLILLLAVPTAHSLALPVSADENDAVLVQGNPPLTEGMVNQLIELFGWILDGRFTREQRDQFAQQLIAEWRRGDGASINNYVNFIRLPARLQNATEEQKRNLHDKLQAALLDIFRKSPNDEISRLMLAVYHAGRPGNAQDSSRVSAQGADREGENLRGGGVPNILVGKWEYGTVSSVTFMNPGTGSYADPSGFRYSYQISADGRYIYAGLLQSSLYNCTMRVFKYKTGVVSVQGSTIVFAPDSYELKSEDNCHRDFNYVKHPAPEKEIFRWSIERDNSGQNLCFEKPDGKPFGCMARQ